eukprot:TRINITY_DN24091_c0_g1_i1.p1 TRINITY_DN24091_c0_g1~~TRINITY_DN24091_c0_g1_i1.p1  ORF type:complete len:454 (-),score=-17.79 TRINITY_DN24091_c0_g1_i1:34-1395(-)
MDQSSQQQRSLALPLLSLALTLAVFLLTDPLGLSPIAGLPFHPVVIPLAPRALPAPTDTSDRLAQANHRFQGEAFGPESIAWDLDGRGPYTGVSDGRILRRSLDDSHWETFAYASPFRTAELCDVGTPSARPTPPRVPFVSTVGASELAINDDPSAPSASRPSAHWPNDAKTRSAAATGGVGPRLATEHICGRPLGLRFHPVTGDLFFADSYFGIFRVGRAGGRARLLADRVEGRRLRFANDLAIDADDENGTVYFTDSSARFHRRDYFAAIAEGQRDGRLLKLDLSSGHVSVLVDGLAFPNGVALSHNGTFLVFCETTTLRCHRYWLKGPKANTHEVFVDLPGMPDNVRLNPRGCFWISVHGRRNFLLDFVAARPWIRAIFLSLPISSRLAQRISVGRPNGLVLEVDEDGRITNMLEDRKGKVVKSVSEVEEREGRLWIGSVLTPHVAVVDL